MLLFLSNASSLQVIPITRSSVRVEWSPLPPQAWSGDPNTGGYRVKYRQIKDILATFNTQSKELTDADASNVVLNDLQVLGVSNRFYVEVDQISLH